MDTNIASESEAQPPGSKTPNGKSSQNKKSLKSRLKNFLSKEPEEGSLKTELQGIIEEHEEGSYTTAADNTILRNVLKFDELRVTDVMTPRLDICSVPADISLDELKKYIDENEHTRIPVFDKNMDDVVGFIHIKDLIAYWLVPRQFKIQEIIREVLFVPPTMKINNLLIKMQNERTHMAIVVDEYGGTSGLVTIEDLVEQIVGEIEDEHDEESQEEFIQTSENTYEALARLPITKLEESLGIKIYADGENADYDTLGGLIYNHLGKIPRIGESFDHICGLNFKVLDADKRHIKRVKVIKNKELVTDSHVTK